VKSFPVANYNAMAGMKMIIVLAFFLASGILSVILSCAIYGNWLPLLVVLTYLIAPIPNSICKRLATSSDLFHEENSSIREVGYFMTSFFVTSGFGLPLVLYHGKLIEFGAMMLSLGGGVMIYGTVVGYIKYFAISSTQEFY
jgi:hypothetical protein